MARKSTTDWLEAGLEALCDGGPARLTIDGLATQLGVTKGSFYHHFANIDDFKARLLVYWEDEFTQRIIARSEEAVAASSEREVAASSDEAERDPVAIMDRIAYLALERGNDPEVAIRAWAQYDADAQAVLERVDERRLSYGQALFTAITGDPDRALVQVQLLYTMLIGSDYLRPPLGRDQTRRVYEEFMRLCGLR
ncbi:MAG: TetR/AcrR family transcriptional regulator [Chloroflexi bacterium]|nr:TetR/AcrR family transcriptional regulator [Chloroflexota bacterium]